MRPLKMSQGTLHFCTWLAFSIFLSLQPVEASKILFVCPFSAPSHNIVFNSLSKELASRGHHITFITPFPIPSPPKNYKQISNIEVLSPLFKAPQPTADYSMIQLLLQLKEMTVTVCNLTYSMPEIQELIRSARSGASYDLVVSSVFYSDCFYALSHVFNAPLVLMSPSAAFPSTDPLVGNPALPSFAPNIFSAFSDRMTYFERLTNWAMTVLSQIYHNFVLIPAHEAVVREVFGDSVPPLSEIENGVSLILLNSHFSYHYPRPVVPSLVEVGGMHIKPAKPLPEDIQKFMDNAKDGVIYFSMGSNLKSEDLPNATRDALLGAFGELKQKVLWKWEAEKLPGQTPNLKLSKWWPQSDILAHPNTKLFITHGGLLSLQEAVFRGVPLIGVPFFGDQHLNMKRMVSLGVGIEMRLDSITKESILQNIKTILGDPSYAKNMKRLSSIAKDDPQPPLERAAYWVEYVIRHRGAPQLRSAAVDLKWYQFHLVDIGLTVAAAIAVMLSVIVLAAKGVSRLLARKKKPKVKKN